MRFNSSSHNSLTNSGVCLTGGERSRERQLADAARRGAQIRISLGLLRAPAHLIRGGELIDGDFVLIGLPVHAPSIQP
ncbi:MAG TPA: hypothetical protein VFV58_30650 [Blastocatellia bacterium]|jgi:hypothetical protein|nr:hypothetical protein [Blastocatellia bacterium]